MLWKSIQSQFKTIQPQLKKGGTEKKIQVSQRVVSYCQCFTIANARACKGVPFVDQFFVFFQGFWKTKQLFWRRNVRVCFVYALKKHSVTIEKPSSHKQKKERKEKKTGEPKRLRLITNALQLQMQGLARGYPLWTCFFGMCLKDFEKQSSCFGAGKVFECVKVCFVYALKKHSITI